jgi:hypothetical protein
MDRPIQTSWSRGFLTNGVYLLLQIVTKKNLVPDADGISYLGTSTLKFKSVYANAFVRIVVTPSDVSLKTDFVPAARNGLENIDAL